MSALNRSGFSTINSLSCGRFESFGYLLRILASPRTFYAFALDFLDVKIGWCLHFGFRKRSGETIGGFRIRFSLWSRTVATARATVNLGFLFLLARIERLLTP